MWGTAVILFLQIDAPTPGNELYWIAGLLAAACASLFTLYVLSKDAQIKSKDDQIKTEREDHKETRGDFSKTVDSLRSLSDASDRLIRDQAATTETTKQALLSVAADVRKLAEAVGMVDRRLERLEGTRRPQEESR